ncbi:hypothetical protein RIF29_28667 [Crotalaria pallida]|uniref:Uncharacterized protein n=1 Tax=Crotalaria pallida TaxID=3830 RepID=A0AAN9EF90_CROPI
MKIKSTNLSSWEEGFREKGQRTSPLCESEGLEIDSDCMLRKSGDASLVKASLAANDEVRVVSEVIEDLCAETPFNPMDPQQCMAAFLETLLQENAIAKPSECVKVDCTTVVGENAPHSIKKHKTPTPLKYLVIDVTDNDLSIDLHDFTLASPDSEDDLKGQLLASNSQPSTPSFSKGGNVSNKTVKISSSAKGGCGSRKERGAGIPKMYKTLFRPASDMELSTKEAQVFAYIFGSGLDLKAISAKCTIIYAIVSAPYFGGNIHSSQEFCDWDMMDARGIPNCGSSDSSSLWVVDWMEMDDSFQPNLIGVLKEVHVRVKTPLALVMGPYNLFKRQTEAYALAKWNELN